MALLASTVVVMLGLGVAKLRVGRRLDSQTVIADGRFSLVGGSLAGTVLIGLALTAVLGWWWADALLAIVISVLAFKEGRDALFGDDAQSLRPPEPVGSRNSARDRADPRPEERDRDRDDPDRSPLRIPAQLWFKPNPTAASGGARSAIRNIRRCLRM